jgi:ParB-like chromosome segregation protein Spo0J
MIKWTEKLVKVKDLKPFERNPRKISEQDFERPKKSLSENGYHQRIIATIDLRIIGGHQRIRALKELGLLEIQVLVPNKILSDDQFKRLLIQDTFEYIKADGSVEMRKFITPDSNEDSMTTKATDEAAVAAEPVADTTVAKAATGETAAEPAADAKAADPIVKVDTGKDGKAVKPKSAPMQKWVASGTLQAA